MEPGAARRWDGYLASLPDALPGSPLFWMPAQLAALGGTSVAARLERGPALPAVPAAAAACDGVAAAVPEPWRSTAELPTQVSAGDDFYVSGSLSQFSF